MLAMIEVIRVRQKRRYLVTQIRLERTIVASQDLDPVMVLSLTQKGVDSKNSVPVAELRKF
jgi:hypothetical protein